MRVGAMLVNLYLCNSYVVMVIEVNSLASSNMTIAARFDTGRGERCPHDANDLDMLRTCCVYSVGRDCQLVKSDQTIIRVTAKVRKCRYVCTVLSRPTYSGSTLLWRGLIYAEIRE